ncbi:MAG: AmmeMemoRadiSam system protein B [Planctomycetota bacterium]|nr:AmmeMemoRadiSam system protein B [Planctomycetota bacterium]
MGLKRPGFAGSWYPASAAECEREIKQFVSDAAPARSKARKVGGIVPHAGWFYSGKAACNVFHALKSATKIDTVILFATHMHPRSPNIVVESGEFWTPFGNIRVAEKLARAAVKAIEPLTEVETLDAAEHEHDNTMELQLPFIRHFFPEAEILPISVAPARAAVGLGAAVTKAAQEMKLGVIAVGSTDLTHYGPNYGFTPKGSGTKALAWVKEENDKKAVDSMLAMDAELVVSESLANQNACCGGAAAAAVAAAKQLGATKGELLQYYTSYDIQPNSSFVGYAGVVFVCA